MQIAGDILNTSLWEEEPEDCGRTRYDKEKNLIVDHSKARVGEFPWVVRVGAVDKVNNKPLFICGGTLISKRFVFSNVQCGIRAQM